VTLPVADVIQLRKLAADRDFQKARADDAVNQSLEWQRSVAKWETLYLAEKRRADEVQGGRVGDLTAANVELHKQADADRVKIGELNAEIISLKAGRKWWFVAGAVAGGVAGYAVGASREKIQTIVTGLPQARPQFGMKLSF
jgi:hypothetical protein